MVQNKETININLTVPTSWEKLNEKQLRYVFGLIAHGIAMPQIKTFFLDCIPGVVLPIFIFFKGNVTAFFFMIEDVCHGSVFLFGARNETVLLAVRLTLDQ